MQFDEIEFLWKTRDSLAAAARRSAGVKGGYVVNGIPIDEETRARIPHTAAGEAAVFVPDDVLDRLKDLL